MRQDVRNVALGRKKRCDASQDARDAQDAEYPALASGRNAGGSDAESVFADVSYHDAVESMQVSHHDAGATNM